MVQNSQKIQFIHSLVEIIKIANVGPLYLLYDGQNFIKLENPIYFCRNNNLKTFDMWLRRVKVEFGDVLKKSNCKILIFAAHEIGNEFIEHVMPNKLIYMLGKLIGRENVFCIINNNTTSQTNLLNKFQSDNILYCNYWEMHTVSICKSLKYKPNFKVLNVKKDYLCSVNKLKILRLGILLELYHRNLWKKGYVNLLSHPTHAPKSFDYCFHGYQLDRLIDKTKAAEILKLLPFSYDISIQPGDDAWDKFGFSPIDNSLMTQIEQQYAKFYINSYCSIVMETHDGVCQPADYFLTEKTVKPLYWGHPFVILSQFGDLGRLKQQGYETFNDYCDEAYDQEKDWKLRIKKVCDALEQLIANKDSKIGAILEYNHNHLLNICNNNFTYLYNMLGK